MSENKKSTTRAKHNRQGRSTTRAEKTSEVERQALPEKSQGEGHAEEDERIKNIVTEILSQSGIVAQAVERAPGELEKDHVATAVSNASTLEAKKTAVATAVETAADEKEKDLVQEAIGNTSTLEARKTAVATAVNTADPENKQAVAKEAMEGLSSADQRELAHQFLPSREAADKIWVMIVKTFAIVLVVGIIGLVGVVALAVFRDVDKDLVQIMLTVFSTAAGILAGFITGQAVGTSANR